MARDHEIEPDAFDVLVLLSQDSCRAFAGHVRPGGVIIFEEDLVKLPSEVQGKRFALSGHPHRGPGAEAPHRDQHGGAGLRRGGEPAARPERPRGDDPPPRPERDEELNLRAFAEGWRRGEAQLG